MVIIEQEVSITWSTASYSRCGVMIFIGSNWEWGASKLSCLSGIGFLSIVVFADRYGQDVWGNIVFQMNDLFSRWRWRWSSSNDCSCSGLCCWWCCCWVGWRVAVVRSFNAPPAMTISPSLGLTRFRAIFGFSTRHNDSVLCCIVGFHMVYTYQRRHLANSRGNRSHLPHCMFAHCRTPPLASSFLQAFLIMTPAQ